MAQDNTMQKLMEEAKVATVYKTKETEIKKDRIDRTYDDLVERKKDIELQKTISLSPTQDYLEELYNDNNTYFEAAKNSPVFLDDQFRGVVPLFENNIILIGAPTGEGKSTISANISYQTIIQKGAPKVLVITNEEVKRDVYNRVVCLANGWPYNDHSKVSPEQVQIFNEMTKVLSHRMIVVDDAYQGRNGMTTTVEGIESLLEQVVKEGNHFGLIILDYYQNVDSSKKNPEMNQYECQAKLANMLDKFKKRIKAPIIVLCQLTNDKDADKTAFKYRIEGRKSINNKATMSLEVVTDKQHHKTSFIVRKARFPDTINKEYPMGFDKGKYVKYDKGFEMRIQTMIANRENAAILNKRMNKDEK